MKPRANGHPFRCPRAFSLLEVVVAIGIFAAGVVAVIGLFGALARSIGANTETTVAENLGGLLQEHLQSRVTAGASFAPVSRLMSATADNPAAGPPLYVSRDGARIGEDADPIFAGSDRDKFFLITLLPLSGQGGDPALVFPYVAEVRWPASAQGGTVPTDATSQRQVFLVGAVSQ